MSSIFYINFSNRNIYKEINYYKNIIKEEENKVELNNYYVDKLNDIDNINEKINILLLKETELKNSINEKNNQKNNLKIKIYNLLY